MTVKTLKVGEYQTNCYLVIEDHNCLIVDPGADYIAIKASLKGLKPLKILLTHNHFDHTGAINKLKEDFDLEVLNFDDVEEKKYKIDNFSFEVIFTPGHTKDSITFYFKEDKAMFTGDFLFNKDIGRCDLPTGSIKEMQNSINKIKMYSRDIIIYPGHDEESILGDEFDYNPYFNQ